MRGERMTMAAEQIQPIKREQGVPALRTEQPGAVPEPEEARILAFKKTKRQEQAQQLAENIQHEAEHEDEEELMDLREANAIKNFLIIGYTQMVRDMVKQALPGLRNFFKRGNVIGHVISYEPEVVDGVMNALVHELQLRRAEKKGEQVVRLRKQINFSKETVVDEASKLYSAGSITGDELREALFKKAPNELSAALDTREDKISFAGRVMYEKIKRIIEPFSGVSRVELAAALDNVPPEDGDRKTADVFEFPKNKDEKDLPPAA